MGPVAISYRAPFWTPPNVSSKECEVVFSIQAICQLVFPFVGVSFLGMFFLGGHLKTG